MSQSDIIGNDYLHVNVGIAASPSLFMPPIHNPQMCTLTKMLEAPTQEPLQQP